MLDNDNIQFFRKELLNWFSSNKRDFPWRKHGLSSYVLITTEILLQKTKAETVSKYFKIFFNKYPNWESIIESDIEEIETTLKPLGLYKRKTIRLIKIADEYKEKQGVLPKNKNELLESNLSTLYTSNAYELFILNKRAPLFDVNMSRLLSRYFNIMEFKDIRRSKKTYDLAKEIIDIKKVREINWAILDYASLVCKALKPLCFDCALKEKCVFFKEKRV